MEQAANIIFGGESLNVFKILQINMIKLERPVYPYCILVNY